MRFIPLFAWVVAAPAMAYGTALSIGPGIGLFFLGFVVFVLFIGVAWGHDRIREIEKQLSERGLFTPTTLAEAPERRTREAAQ
jgi:hypothetical protein